MRQPLLLVEQAVAPRFLPNFFGGQIGLRRRDLLLDRGNLVVQLAILGLQLGVQRLAALLPLLLALFGKAQLFRRHLFGRAVSAFACRRLGPPIQHQEH
jgi:hypothetical protein